MVRSDSPPLHPGKRPDVKCSIKSIAYSHSARVHLPCRRSKAEWIDDLEPLPEVAIAVASSDDHGCERPWSCSGADDPVEAAAGAGGKSAAEGPSTNAVSGRMKESSGGEGTSPNFELDHVGRPEIITKRGRENTDFGLLLQTHRPPPPGLADVPARV